MTEKPILFSAPMVRAILDGRKTQTRRILKPQPNSGPNGEIVDLGGGSWGLSDGVLSGEWKLHQVGDLLWVREAWRVHDGGAIRDGGGGVMDYVEPEVIYKADSERSNVRWKSPIHMPRWASRITLRVTGVNVERLQDISEEDAKAEGVRGNAGGAWGAEGLIEDFSDLWDSINGPGSWDANPWIAAYTFEMVAP